MTGEVEPSFRGSGAEKDTPRQRVLRLGFLVLLAGGLLVWTQLRKPRPLAVELDLAAAFPGELSEVDLTFKRGDRLLARKDLLFGPEGAPQLLREEIEATPGPVELEAELVYRGHPATRALETLTLSSDAPARLTLPAAVR